MAVPANTFDTLTAVGNREDLSNELSRISPEKTPFMSNIGKAKAEATFTEWQLEELDPVDTDNSHLEGDDTAIQASTNRERVGNRTQIFKKSGSITGTQQAVDTAAVADELDHQKMLKLKAMKRDMEFAMIANRGSQKQNGATKRQMAGALAWITTNVNRGTGGTNGGFSGSDVTAATDGTQRSFTEDQVQDIMLQRFNSTGESADNLIAYMSGAHKEQFGAFAGLSETRDSVTGKKGKRVIYGAADVYVSHFGTITAIPHAYALTRDALFVDPSKFKKATLRAVTSSDLPRNGDSMPFQLIGECTLKSLNEKASAVVADLT